MNDREYQVCTNCVMDTSDSVIRFDDKGMCDHCHNYYENILPYWHTDERGQESLRQILNKIKADGKNRPYDCLIGLSGGVDSSYLCYIAKEQWGLRPLIVTVDTGWDLPVAIENVDRIVSELKADREKIAVDWPEMKDLQTAYFRSQVPYQDTPQDHAIFAAVYNYAAQHGFHYVLTGGNFSTECVREPNEWVHINDLRQIKDIHKRFGTIPLKHFPQCGIFKYRILYRYMKGMKIIKPLDWIPYTKETAIQALHDRFGWTRYQNKHYENRFTRFYEGYWLPHKFGYDKRRAHFSSLILTGQLDRDEALRILAQPPYDEAVAMEDMAYICERLEISVGDFQKLMAAPNKTWRDYKSDKGQIDLAIRFAQLIGMERRKFR